MAPTASVWARLGVALGAVLISALVFEVGLRILGTGPVTQVVLRDTLVPSDDPQLGYELLPHADEQGLPISSQGLRDDEYVLPKPQGVFRIAALGDSVTYASTLHRGDAWPQQLAGALRAGPPGETRVEVPNLGVTGYNLPQIARRLATRGLALEPDLFVYAYVLNDVQQYSFEFEALKALQQEAAPRPALRWLSQSRLFLLARQALAPRSAREVNLRRYADPAYTVANDDERTRYYRALHREAGARERLASGFAELAEVARQAGIPGVVAIFPLFHVLGDDYPLRDVHQQIARAAARAGLDVIDLRAPYQAAHAARERFGIERLDADFLHPNAAGQRVAALSLAHALARRGLLPEPIAASAGAGFVGHPIEPLLRSALESDASGAVPRGPASARPSS